jgi:hypothetical protein
MKPGRRRVVRLLALVSLALVLAYFLNATVFAFLYNGQWKRDPRSFAVASESDAQSELKRLDDDVEQSGLPEGPLQERRDELVAGLREAVGYEDFFYFSVVTMTTVGYGDIVPDTRQVRRLVYLQLMLTVLFTAVAIPLFFAVAQRRQSAGER